MDLENLTNEELQYIKTAIFKEEMSELLTALELTPTFMATSKSALMFDVLERLWKLWKEL